jgi:hypothetical protein
MRFDENKKKTVHKRENASWLNHLGSRQSGSHGFLSDWRQVRSGGVDDLLKADNWGSVEITDIGWARWANRGESESPGDVA